MRVKENQALNAFEELFSSNIVKSALIQIGYFAMGLLVSRGAVLGSYAPFGTAFLAAVPYNNLWASAAGVILGCMLPSSVSASMRYIAASLAVVAIRWTLSDLKKVNRHPLYAPLTAFLPSVATGLAISLVLGFSGNLVIMVITEALLSAAGAYFFARTTLLITTSKNISALDQQEFACVSMTICIAVLSFAGVNIGGVSLGRIIAILIILFCSKYAGVSGGSVSGIATGIIFSISSTNLYYLSGAYAFGGMMAGLFSPIGKIGVCAAFILSNAIVSFESGDSKMVITGLYEVMVATLIFMIVPQKVTDVFSQIFKKSSKSINTGTLRKSIVMRLDFASKAIASVSESIDSVSKKLAKLSTPNLKGVFAKAIEQNCNYCGLKVFCWEKEYEHTNKAFGMLASPLSSSGAIDEKEFSSRLATKCCKSKEMVLSVNQNYDEFLSNQSAERRMSEIRNVIGEQFLGVGELLNDIAREFENYEKFDHSAEEKITYTLKNLGINIIDVSCRLNKLNRISVEIEAINTDRRKINKFSLSKEISKACGHKMDTPCISYTPDRCRIQLSQRPEFDVEIGSSQHICNNGTLCGDNFCYFKDGLGRIVIIISDGMGTGGRAAVDGAMATNIMCKLIRAGIGFDCALKVVNSALVVKSSEESLATLDILCIDLFTGTAEFMKAGAPVSFIKKGSDVINIDNPALPLGILTDINFSKKSTSLNEDNWVLMISDGAILAPDDWIKTEFKKLNDVSAKDFATYIVNEASKRRMDEHDDDITVLAIRLIKN